MEFPVAFLQDCARADKWLPFVCHAQSCQFPKEQVRALHCIKQNAIDRLNFHELSRALDEKLAVVRI